MQDNKSRLNKKGSTLSNWVYIILVVSLFVVVFQTQVLDNMNELYNQSNSMGLSATSSSAIDSIKNTTQSSSDDIDNAEVSQLSDGITILEIGAIAKRTFSMLWTFVSGSFIKTILVDQLDMPVQVATVLQVLIWISLIFVMVRIFTRGVTP